MALGFGVHVLVVVDGVWAGGASASTAAAVDVDGAGAGGVNYKYLVEKQNAPQLYGLGCAVRVLVAAAAAF